MAVNWYVFENDEMAGPMSAAELLQRARQGKVRPNTRVRKGEDGEWVLADRIKGLFNDNIAPTVPSPVSDSVDKNSTGMNAPVIRVDATKNVPKSQRSMLTVALMTLTGLACISAIIFLLQRADDGATAGASPKAPNADAPANAPIESPQTSVVAPAVAVDVSQRESGNAENKSASGPKEKVSYWDVYESLDLARYSTVSWELGVVSDQVKYSLLSPSDVAEQMLKAKGADPSGLLAKHATSLSEFLASLRKIDVEFLNSDKPPVEIRGKDGQPCLVITNVATTSALNTRRFTEKQRAAKSLELFVFPLLQELDEHLYAADIPYYCILFYYGSQDFAERTDIMSVDGEVLAIIVSRDDCHAFGTGRISQEKFLSSSELFIGAMSVKPRRVEVTLE